MILLFHHKDILINKFSNFLSNNHIPHVNIDIHKFVNSTSIKTYLMNSKTKTYWQFENESEPVDFDSISSIYHNLLYPPKDMFFDFEEEDIDYCRAEWFSYFIYEFSKHKRCVNAVAPVGYFNPAYSLPSVYTLAKNFGLKVPPYILFPNSEALEKLDKTFCFKQSIYDFTDYSVNYNSLKKPQIAVKMARGAKILATFTGNKDITTIQYKDSTEDFVLPDTIKSACIQLMAALKLSVCQFFFMLDKEDNFIYYHTTPKIKYEQIRAYPEDFFKNLASYLLEVE